MLLDKIENLNVNLCSVLYYLYKQAGTPYENTYQGFTLWVDIMFEEFVNQHT